MEAKPDHTPIPDIRLPPNFMFFFIPAHMIDNSLEPVFPKHGHKYQSLSENVQIVKLYKNAAYPATENENKTS